MDSKIIAVVAVIKVDVAWVDADVVIWVTDKIVVVMVAHHVADMADITMGTSVAVLEVDTAVVEAAMAALQEAVMAMDQSQEVVIIMVSLVKVLTLFLFIFRSSSKWMEYWTIWLRSTR